MTLVGNMSARDQLIIRAMIGEVPRHIGFDYQVRLGVSREESSEQGQRTLSRLSDKDFGEEVVAPTGDLHFSP